LKCKIDDNLKIQQKSRDSLSHWTNSFEVVAVFRAAIGMQAAKQLRLRHF